MKILKTLVLLIITAGLTGCHQNKDADYFNGKILYFDDNQKIVKNITSKDTPLKDVLSYGFVSVYDSLVVIWNPQLPENFFSVYNIDTGREIGFFCNKGKGNKEYVSLNPVFQLFKKNNNIMTLLHPHNENEILLWNISQSVAKGTTVLDTIVSYHTKNREQNAYFDNLFYHSDNTLLAKVSFMPLSTSETKPSYYEKRTIYSNELIKEFPIYKTSVKNDNTANFYHTNDVIKPDGSKIVQAMYYLPQINIIDTNTGEIIGYRMPQGPDFSLFDEEIMGEEKVYYNSIQADDNYIYATYYGEKQWDTSLGATIPNINTIHIFDWNGKQIYELTTDRTFFRIWLDKVRNRLYTMDLYTSELFYIDLNEFYRG